MAVTTHHVHNILRTYSKQLSQGNGIAVKREIAGQYPSDQATTSVKARRKAVIEKVTSDIVDRIIHQAPPTDTDEEILGRDQNRSEKSHPGSEDGSEFIFRVIDKEQGEIMRTMSIRDSKFLKDELKEISKRKGP
jgi:hypothetical protein